MNLSWHVLAADKHFSLLFKVFVHITVLRRVGS